MLGIFFAVRCGAALCYKGKCTQLMDMLLNYFSFQLGSISYVKKPSQLPAAQFVCLLKKNLILCIFVLEPSQISWLSWKLKGQLLRGAVATQRGSCYCLESISNRNQTFCHEPSEMEHSMLWKGGETEGEESNMFYQLFSQLCSRICTCSPGPFASLFLSLGMLQGCCCC